MSEGKSLRFLYVAAPLCAACVGAAVWLWTRAVGSTDLLAHRVLDSVPQAVSGVDVDDSSFLLSVDRDGTIYANGVKTPLAQLQELLGKPGPDRDVNAEPVLLEVDPSLSVADLNDLLELLIVKSWRVNIALLVSTPDGLRSVTLPITGAHCCQCLLFYDGGYCHDEHSNSRKHVWIHARPSERGEAIVNDITIGWSATDAVVEHVAGETEAVDSTGASHVREAEKPVGDESTRVGGSSPSNERASVGDHSAFGVWSPETIRGYVETPRSDGLSAFVHLEVRRDDRIAGVLACLASTKAALGRRVVVAIPCKPRDRASR